MLDKHFFPFAIKYLGFAKLDSLVRCWAVLFTDDAWYTLGIRQAAVLVKKNVAYL